MEIIIAIPFIFSTIINGASFTVGAGYAENENVFISPVGIMRIETSLYEEKNWKLSLKMSHLSSIPEPLDNIDGTDINMASVEFTVNFGGK